jgi:hypothetical protein
VGAFFVQGAGKFFLIATIPDGAKGGGLGAAGANPSSIAVERRGADPNQALDGDVPTSIATADQAEPAGTE